MLAEKHSQSLRPFLRVVYANSTTLRERCPEVPPGFHHCQHCGEYTGGTKAKYLCWDLPVLDPEEAISVRCLCEGIRALSVGSDSFIARFRTHTIWRQTRSGIRRGFPV